MASFFSLFLSFSIDLLLKGKTPGEFKYQCALMSRRSQDHPSCLSGEKVWYFVRVHLSYLQCDLQLLVDVLTFPHPYQALQTQIHPLRPR